MSMASWLERIDPQREAERNETTDQGCTLQVGSLLRRAVDHLVERRYCSPQEALEWIHQEARAKRASLMHVASAALAGNTVGYHYNAPV